MSLSNYPDSYVILSLDLALTMCVYGAATLPSVIFDQRSGKESNNGRKPSLANRRREDLLFL